MTLYFIGLGLWDASDLSVRARAIIHRCSKVFVETYTSRLMGVTWHDLEIELGRGIETMDRAAVERAPDVMLEAATEPETDIAFLVVGDAMAATTHLDLRLRAHERGIETRIIHGASVFTAVPGLLGLQHYKFGRTTTIGYPDPSSGYFPTSPYAAIEENHERGLHTLVLLDIRADEERFMTASEALALFEELEGRCGRGLFLRERLVCVVGRAGAPSPTLRADALAVLQSEQFGPPLHSIVVPGRLHFMEEDALVALAGAPRSLVDAHEAYYRERASEHDDDEDTDDNDDNEDSDDSDDDSDDTPERERRT